MYQHKYLQSSTGHLFLSSHIGWHLYSMAFWQKPTITMVHFLKCCCWVCVYLGRRHDLQEWTGWGIVPRACSAPSGGFCGAPVHWPPAFHWWKLHSAWCCCGCRSGFSPHCSGSPRCCSGCWCCYTDCCCCCWPRSGNCGWRSGCCSPCGRGEKWTRKGKVSQSCWLRRLVRTGYPESWLTWCWRTGGRETLMKGGGQGRHTLVPISTPQDTERHCIFLLFKSNSAWSTAGRLIQYTDNFSNCKYCFLYRIHTIIRT